MSIGGLFDIIFTIIILLQIQRRTHNIYFYFFDQIKYNSVFLQSIKVKSVFNTRFRDNTANKIGITCILIRFPKFKAFKVSVFYLSIGGLFCIIFTIEIPLQIKLHTHNPCFRCSDQITYNSVLLQFIKAKSSFDTLSPKEHGKNGEFMHIDSFAQV